MNFVTRSEFREVLLSLHEDIQKLREEINKSRQRERYRSHPEQPTILTKLDPASTIETRTPITEQKQEHGYQFWSLFIQVLTLFAVAAYAVVTYRQVDILHKSAMPRLTIMNITPSSPNNIPNFIDNGRLHVSFSSPNYGGSPAKSLVVKEFDSVTSWKDAKRLNYGQPRWEYPQIVFATTVGVPGYGMNGEHILTEDEIKGLQLHTLVATFSVLIEYRDDFGDVHHAEYCDQFTFNPYVWNQPCPWPIQND